MSLSVRDDRATAEEVRLVAAIRGGDEAAFAAAVERFYPAMVALAGAYVGRRDIATRVVHDAWMAALAAGDRFDGSMPLRTWLLRHVVGAAGPLAASSDSGSGATAQPAVDPQRFRGPGDAFPGHWRAYPRDWATLADDVLRGEAVRRAVESAGAALPVQQRTVITLRDVVGCPAEEACAVLDLSEPVARERLHSARSQVRAALERHFDG